MEEILKQTAGVVNVGNLKTISELTSLAAGQIAQGGADHLNAMRAAREMLFLGAYKNANEVDPSESVATKGLVSGDAVAEKLSNLIAALASNQQASGISANTPPA